MQKFRVCLGVCGTQTMSYAFDVGWGRKKNNGIKEFSTFSKKETNEEEEESNVEGIMRKLM